MKKLKTWQFVLLIIFYPVGIIYFIVWLCKRNKTPTVSIEQRNIIRDMHSKVVGVTFGNDDGTSRQAYIEKLKPGDELILKPMPTPDYPNAIGVFTVGGKQIGYVKDELAVALVNEYPKNLMQVTVANITGGGDKNYGCNIHIVIYE